MSDKTLALAGIFQAAALVHQLATTGIVEKDAAYASIESLFIIDAHDVPSVYSGVDGVNVGLKSLASYDGREKSEVNLAILAYVFSLMHLTHKIQRQPELFEKLTSLINSVQRQKNYFDGMQTESEVNSTLFARFADIYSETISTLQPKIIVKGDPGFLQQENIVNQIRSLLLAGARSAVLWEQLGGGRIQFLLKRKKFVKIAEEMLGD